MSSSRKILLTRLNLESHTSFDGIDNDQNKPTNKQTNTSEQFYYLCGFEV